MVVAVLIGSALAQGWISDFLSPTAEQISNQRQRVSALPSHMGKSITARFVRMPIEEQNAIRSNLEQQLQSVDTWLESIARAKPQILCLGEEHEQSTRSFLTEKIFPRLDLDVLMLETTSAGLEVIDRAIQSKQSFVPLEGANIRPVIKAVREKNPDVTLVAIEETKPQRLRRIKLSNQGFRDDTLAVNFWKHYQKGKRHALIFGALHCGDNANWLYAQIRKQAPEHLRTGLLNVRVLGDYQNESLQAMVYFLKTISMTQEDFVVPDTALLHPEVKQWLALLVPTLRDYQTLLVFRSEAYLHAQ